MENLRVLELYGSSEGKGGPRELWKTDNNVNSCAVERVDYSQLPRIPKISKVNRTSQAFGNDSRAVHQKCEESGGRILSSSIAGAPDFNWFMAVITGAL
ncbi:hypothetical protein SUGI_0669960 [Cryptomeria japonica]|nr:hypothetical protein SUGI_0669960 [Cryptomeria japonica]